MRVCQKSQVVRPEGAIWAFSSHCLSFDPHASNALPNVFYVYCRIYFTRAHRATALHIDKAVESLLS